MAQRGQPPTLDGLPAELLVRVLEALQALERDADRPTGTARSRGQWVVWATSATRRLRSAGKALRWDLTLCLSEGAQQQTLDGLAAWGAQHRLQRLQLRDHSSALSTTYWSLAAFSPVTNLTDLAIQASEPFQFAGLGSCLHLTRLRLSCCLVESEYVTFRYPWEWSHSGTASRAERMDSVACRGFQELSAGLQPLTRLVSLDVYGLCQRMNFPAIPLNALQPCPSAFLSVRRDALRHLAADCLMLGTTMPALPSLEALRLTGFLCWGQQPLQLSPGVFGTHLTFLSLSCALLRGSFGGLPGSLRVLELSQCNWEDGAGQSLGALLQLTELHLMHKDDLEMGTCVSLPDPGFGLLTALQRLALSGPGGWGLLGAAASWPPQLQALHITLITAVNKAPVPLQLGFTDHLPHLRTVQVAVWQGYSCQLLPPGVEEALSARGCQVVRECQPELKPWLASTWCQR